jgi:uncharacterized protein (DUF433 family)
VPVLSSGTRLTSKDGNESIIDVERQTDMGQKQPLYRGRIIADPEILVGKPVIAGTRISVELMLEYLAHNLDFNEFFADYLI